MTAAELTALAATFQAEREARTLATTDLNSWCLPEEDAAAVLARYKVEHADEAA